ncbi:hypothetical protein J6590_025368 [Homalodisca vitripennis]|nr:hypothetical protein J6590_025368 [Homalodisca vitripennis]
MNYYPLTKKIQWMKVSSLTTQKRFKATHPLFLPGVKNVSPTIQALDSMNSQRTHLNVSFYTHQLKQEGTYRVVLKNKHYYSSIEDLKQRSKKTWRSHKSSLGSVRNTGESGIEKFPPLYQWEVPGDPTLGNL